MKTRLDVMPSWLYISGCNPRPPWKKISSLWWIKVVTESQGECQPVLEHIHTKEQICNWKSEGR